MTGFFILLLAIIELDNIMVTVKKIAGIIVVALILIAAFAAWRLFGGNTNFSENKKSFYIKTGSSFNDVMNGLAAEGFLKNPGSFKWVAVKLDYNKKVIFHSYINILHCSPGVMLSWQWLL